MDRYSIEEIGGGSGLPSDIKYAVFKNFHDVALCKTLSEAIATLSVLRFMNKVMSDVLRPSDTGYELSGGHL